ncbi:Aste57867_8098 [Aphanomyces stellatus]|uniref:Aste57867_8098 protein n=1 Tax=Aphanomyces stellatus TaxID=120398 RepID=A0A485KJD1_9STRA|nr:hypothetical protein As57867_008068 [Aphanomyces stellatus]VFT84987.1 Aste57867_8098 [Aphanomyces stellatus]
MPSIHQGHHAPTTRPPSSSIIEILPSVTSSELMVLDPALLNLWEFGPTTINPITSVDLRQWANRGELIAAMTLTSNSTATSVQSAIADAIDRRQPCNDVTAMASGRMLVCEDSVSSSKLLTGLGCPPSLYTPSRSFEAPPEVSQGLYWLDANRFEPTSARFDDTSLPCLDLTCDVVVHLAAGYVHKSARGTGLYEQLFVSKIATMRSVFQRTVEAGRQLYFLFATREHAGFEKLMLLNLKATSVPLAAMATDVLGTDDIPAMRVVHWRLWDDSLQLHRRASLLWLDPRMCHETARL